MARASKAGAKPTAPKIIIGDGTLSKAEEEKMAFLIILHLADRQIAEGRFVPLDVAMKRVRARLRWRRARKR